MTSLLQRIVRRGHREAKALLGPKVRSVRRRSDRAFLRLVDPEVRNELLEHFGRRVASAWPAVPDVITDLRIDLSRMTDDEIVARAERALDADLHPSGLKPRFTASGNIDWGHNPASSREWLLMIHRHAWWPLWGAAYRLTGDEKYARAFVAQLLDWIARNPMPAQEAENTESWRLMETGLRIRVSWIPSFGCFYESKAFNDDAKLTMLRSIYDHGQFLNRFFTNRNHLVRESNGLLATALCFQEFRESSTWFDNAACRLSKELGAQVNKDGSHLEMSVGYQWLTVDEFEVTRSLLERYGRTSAIEGLDTALRKMYGFLAAVIRPDRSFPQLNDGFILWDADRLVQVAAQRHWDDILYAGSAGKAGAEPQLHSQSFPNAGFHIMRSDWTANARYLVADTGPYGGPHGHEDKLSFELSAWGARFIVDPGSYTYNNSDPYRNYFVGSQGHNTVLVDGGSQVRRWNTGNMTPTVEDVEHGAWRSASDIDVAAGHYDEGYAPFNVNGPAGDEPMLDVEHYRDFAFLKPDYFVIADYLAANSPHRYTFLFHLAPGTLVDSLDAGSAIVRAPDNGACLVIKGLSSLALQSELIEGSESPIQGWYSQDHHKKVPSPVLSFSTAAEAGAFVAWLLYPLPPGGDAHAVTARLDVDAGEPTARVIVQRRNRVEQVLFSHNATSVQERFAQVSRRTGMDIN